jgi:hypothetical protein
MPDFDPEYAPAPYADLDSANAEIRRLQKAVFNERLKIAKQVEKQELTRRSLIGRIKQLERELRELKGDHEQADSNPATPRRTPGGSGGWTL